MQSTITLSAGMGLTDVYPRVMADHVIAGTLTVKATYGVAVVGFGLQSVDQNPKNNDLKKYMH